jgi:hypothetical protein
VTTLYGAMTMLPLAWALAGYALVSRRGVDDAAFSVRRRRPRRPAGAPITQEPTLP